MLIPWNVRHTAISWLHVLVPTLNTYFSNYVRALLHGVFLLVKRLFGMCAWLNGM